MAAFVKALVVVLIWRLWLLLSATMFAAGAYPSPRNDLTGGITVPTTFTHNAGTMAIISGILWTMLRSEGPVDIAEPDSRLPP